METQFWKKIEYGLNYCIATNVLDSVSIMQITLLVLGPKQS